MYYQTCNEVFATLCDGQIVELYDYMSHFEQWRASDQMPLEFFDRFRCLPPEG